VTASVAGTALPSVDCWSVLCPHALPHANTNPTPAQSATRRDLVNPDIDVPSSANGNRADPIDAVGEYRGRASARP